MNKAKNVLYDALWVGPLGAVIVEFKRTSNVRDVRDGLIALAYALDNEPHGSQALLLLGKSRLTRKRLQEEANRFRAIVRPELAQRIWLAEMDEEGAIRGEIPQDGLPLRDYLKTMASQEFNPAGERVNRDSVKAHLLHHWLGGNGPITQAQLRRDTQASAPTVAAAMADFERQGLLHTTPTGVMLHEPSWEAWRRLAEAYAAKRTEVRFEDPSGMARSPMVMLQRLRDLQANKGVAQSVCVSGVIGAMFYDTHFDTTAPPRLDLCVYDGDLDFMRRLDAGLTVTKDPKSKAVVVVHMVPSKIVFGIPILSERVAPALDCLADILELGLISEARDFTQVLNQKAKLMFEARSANAIN